MIDAPAARAMLRRQASVVSTPDGDQGGDGRVAVAIAVFGIVGSRAAIERRAAADDVVDSAAPHLLAAQDLYVALADADAAASTIFLRAGLEPTELRQSYVEDLRRAGERLAAIAAGDLGPRASTAAATLTEELAAYNGLVEAARTNSRLGHVVGAAYLRDASDKMRLEILPAATIVYKDAAVRLDDRYRDGTRPATAWVVAATAAAAVLVVGLVQLYVTSRSRRWLNAGLLAAAVIVVAAAAATLLVLRRQADALVESRDDGAEPVTALSTARILTLRSLSDDNLDLIERGDENQEDFDQRIDSIGLDADDGVLDVADPITRSLERGYDDYLAAHEQVRLLAERGDHQAAVEMAVGREADAARALDEEIAELIGEASATLDRAAGRSVDGVTVALPVVIVLAAVAAAIAAVAGLQPRLREYR